MRSNIDMIEFLAWGYMSVRRLPPLCNSSAVCVWLPFFEARSGYQRPASQLPVRLGQSLEMRGVAATAVLALAAGCCAYPHSSKQVGTLQEPPPPTTFRPPLSFANEGGPEDCSEPDTFSGIFPRSSFGGFCCVFCPDNEGNRDALVCCPTIDEHRQEVSASPHPKHNPMPCPRLRS